MSELENSIGSRLGEFTAGFVDGLINVEDNFDLRIWFCELFYLGCDTESFIQRFKQQERENRRNGYEVPKTQREERFDFLVEYLNDEESMPLQVAKEAIFESKYESPPACSVGHEDELFNLMAAQWNISKMLQHIAESDYKVLQGKTEQAIQHNGFIHVDHEFSMKSRRTDPVIFVEMPDGTPLLVDGHHRVHREHQNGEGAVKLIIVPFEQQIRFLTSSEMIDSLIEQREKFDRQKSKEQLAG